MTQAQYQWLKDNGYDPTVYDVDDQGNVFENPIAAPATQQKMSPLRAAGTSFLGNLLPSAAGLGAGAYLAPLALSNPWTGIPTVIAGSLAAGYGTGKLQEKALEEFAPEALQQLAQAETDQPVASYLGGFAPNALAMRPSFGGIRGLTAPAMGMSKEATRAAFLPAAANVGVNVAGSTAGQLINMSQGGEFSAPRFAADVALGSLFADPTKLGRRFGLTPLKPDVAAAASPMDLAALRTAAAESSEAARVAGEAESARIMDETRGQMAAGGMTGREVELFKTRPEMEWWKQPEATRIADIERVAKETKQRLPKGMVAELAGLPEVYDAVQNPEKFPQFLATSLEEALNAAHERGIQNKFLRPEDATIMGRYQDKRLEVMAQKEALKPTPEEAAKAEAIQAENARIEAEQNAAELRKLQDLEAAQALSDEAAARLQVLKSRRAELLYANRGERPNIRQNIREQSDPAIAQAKQELADARAIADDLYSRLQRPGGEGLLSQADLDAAAQLAARRGLRIVPAPPEQQARGIRGAYVVNQNGERVIYINPLAATADTAIHEIGHDVFKTSPNERMQRSLMDTAEGSEAYRREYEARLAARDKNGNPVHTEQQARDIALEEGLVQAFGEQHPNVKPGEIRQWFNALKSSVKSMIGMKLSPEDALAWMHYATTEAVPWKGVAVAKTGDVGGERMQRGSELFGLTNEDFAPSSDPKFLHATHLEQNNPTGLRVAAREPSGKVTIGKLGDLHMDLPAVTENSEFGFVDKTGNFLTREQASAQRANPDIRYQRAQQETPEFKAWFGESKVVDAEGKPLVMYHGTRSPQDFNTFRTDSGHNYGPGAYFTPEARRASGYAGEQEGARVYSTYVSVEKPYTVQSDATIQDLGYKLRQDPANDALIQKLLQKYNSTDKNILGNAEVGNAWIREQGYDGIIKQRNRYTEDGFVPEIVEVVAFKPEQVKSALGNRGTFSPESADIRYQRGPIDRLRNFSEIDSLESRGGIFSQVAQGMRSYYATRKFMQGQAASKEKAMSSLSPERQVMLGKHIGQEFDQQRFIQPPSEIAAAYNEYRNEWQKFWPTETNKVGHTVRTAGGQRARLTDPYYGPFHMWSDSVRDIITTKQGSPEYVKLKDDYIKQHTQFHQQNGVPLQEAQTRAIADFNDAIREMSVPYDPTAVGTFAGARKAQGIPLPESWREYNIMKLVENYDRRSAMDYAMQEHMEKSPEIMAALGADKYFNDQPIPPQIKASVPYIGDDNSVKSILREMSGKPAFRPDALGAGASRSIGALTIGTVSKATEVPTTMIAGLRYLQASDYLPGTMKFIENLADWSALQERSYASGLNKRDGAQNMRQVAGVIGDASGYMNKFAETVSKYTGLNALEKAARTMAQGWGEVLVQINKRKAATGDKEAVRMLDTLSPDWRTRSDADLAGQFGQLMQGSYDMTQLPAWMLESGAAPYLTWSKWSAGQYNSFMKFAIEPALQGNVKPLLGHLLIGVMGGAAVEQIREWMNNREGRDVNWSELESWMQQNQGELGAEGMKQLSVKLLNMVQNVGTFGIAGDLAKMVTTAAVGGTAQGMATAPVANAVFDTSKKVAAALKAIDDGEDFGLVLRQMMLDVAKSHVQVARVGQNWLDEDENLRYDDRRKRRLFDELSGAPTQSGAFSVNYGNLAEREFERGEITEKTGEEAFSLVSRAREEATTPEDYASRIRKYKTSQNQIMPSLERQPMKAARYLSFVEGAEEGAGAETLRRYMTREYENKYRKSLIEGMSGLR
jgi:hypothetical protein